MSLALVALFAIGQMQMDHGSGHDMHAMLRTGLGNVRHPITTKNPQAQKFFNQGLALSYGFNHHAAIAAFQEAARLDPSSAMAHWGIAYAMGPNINLPIDAATNKEAFLEARAAQGLSGGASHEESELISALSMRYNNEDHPNFEELNKAYAAAMGNVAQHYPNDLDVQTLYAESLMDLQPWRYWSPDGKPLGRIDEIVTILQAVLKKDPNHIGANHFLIHALEASPHPELADASAKRLGKLAPQSGHLVHMPSHIYLRTGRWEEGIKVNQAALDVDAAFLEKTPNPGVYPMYYIHNFDMLRACADMEGNYKLASWAAQKVSEKAASMGPMGEPFAAVPFLEMTRFAKWKDVLATPAPASQMPYVQAVYHYARGMALATTGDAPGAQKEYDAFADWRSKVPADFTWGFTPGSQILDVEANLFSARMARARGDSAGEIDLLRKAVAGYDQILYDEPADFFYPVRETLGAALIRVNKHGEAISVFRDELKLHPNSGRALFGLVLALKVDGNLLDIEVAQKALQSSWSHADIPLRLEDF